MSRPLASWSILAFLLSLLGGVASTPAAPEPSIVPRAWEFDFTFQAPRAIAIRDVDGKFHWFWYLSYKVVNNSGSEQMFIPDVVIASERGHIIHAGQNLPSSVFPAIKNKLQNPLLLSPIEVVGKLLQGEDQAKESVAIWPAFDDDVDEITVFIGGLSGETVSLPHPTTGETLLLRKTLRIDYKLPGTQTSPQVQAVLPSGQAWIMR
jgi:hypothetical protein